MSQTKINDIMYMLIYTIHVPKFSIYSSYYHSRLVTAHK